MESRPLPSIRLIGLPAANEAMLVQYVGLTAYEEEVLGWSRSAAKIGPWATEAVERRLEAVKLADEGLPDSDR